MSIKWRTEYPLSQSSFQIRHIDTIQTFGSCFASSMASRASDSGFSVDANPFGVLYNPFSVLQALTDLLAHRRFTEADLVSLDGIWHSFAHHGSFSGRSSSWVLSEINKRIDFSSQFLRSADWLWLTWGSAYCYFLKSDGSVVANCHKFPESHFTRRRLSVSEVVERSAHVFTRLFETNPSVKVILSVSPIRHLRDGLHENALSKSTLLLSVDELCRRFPERIVYFPGYELLIDDLRDYRWYADDLTHPSSAAEQYVWERFCECFISPSAYSAMTEAQKAHRHSRHIPFHQ